MMARIKHPSLPIFLIPFALLIVLIAGCSGGGGGGGGSPSTNSIFAVSWDANRESGVNSTGGGYRVYHSTSPGFAIGSADGVVDVPHASGTTPTSTTLTLSTGTHYIKVVAYSALNPTGSTPSSQIAVTAP